MDKKTMLIVGAVSSVIILIAGGLFAYKNWDDNRPNVNAKYTKCMADAQALQEKNSKILEQVDANIEKCTRDYIKSQGYNDTINCIENSSNPICNQEKYDKNGVNIGRYNAEVNGGNKCNENREDQIKAAGYQEGIPAVDCVKYLGEK